MNMNEILLAQTIGRNDAERYEMMTGRRAPWADRNGKRPKEK